MKHLFKKSLMIALILLTLILNAVRVTPVQAASTWIVNTATDENDHDCSDGDCSLRDALELATAGDTITFDSGLSGATIILASTLTVDKNIIIDGSALDAQVSISGDANNNSNPDLGVDVRVFYIDPGVTATFESLTITRGVHDGGGVRNYGTLAVNDSNFTNNSGGDGGGIYNNGTLTVTNTTFSGNTGSNGAAIFGANGPTTITGSTFTGSTGTRGAVDQLGSTLTVTGSTFTGNNVQSGGALHIWSGTTAAITGSVFSGNTANSGGAIRIEGGTVTISNSTISGNTASWDGGGILVAAGTVTVVNSTIANNQATSPDRVNNGGGIWNQGTVNLYNVTISGNNADDSGGGFYGGILNYTNTIIANSAFGGDCTGTSQINTNLNNLVENGSCSINGVNFIMADPILGALADNGGPTQTMALLFTSPALGAGDQATCDGAPVSGLDQRGELRPQGDASCDIGAFESALLAGDIPPALNSFTRQTPASSLTSADSLVFRATFSEDVQNVDTADFAVNGTTTATVTVVSVADASTYDITVSGGDLADFNGTVGLDLAGGQDIQDLTGNALPAGEPAPDETYTVDNLAPDTSIDSFPNNPTNLTTAQFAFSSADGGVSFECQLDSDGYIACTSPQDYTNLTSGSHTFYVRATDAAGNTDPSPASYTWTVDTTTVYVNVEIGGENQQSYTLPQSSATVDSYTGVNNGPVRVISNSGTSIVSSQRVTWGTGFDELMGYPADQLTNEYVFPWYNNKAMSSQLRIGNTGAVAAEVDVYIAGVKQNATPYVIPVGGSVKLEYAGVNNGPVRIVTETAEASILASQRVIWGAGYDELMGYPADQLTNEYVFPWYNNKAMSSQLRIGNTGGVAADVDVYIGGIKMNTTPYTIAVGGSLRLEYAGINAGPVQVATATSGATILATMRVLWGAGYDELMGYPAGRLTNEYFFPMYSNTSLDTQLRIGNTGAVDVEVDVYAGSTKLNLEVIVIPVGGSVRVDYTGVEAGPLRVVTTTPGASILASERLIKGSGYDELLGFAVDRLTTEYLFPWYNNKAMISEIVIAVP